MNGLAQELAGQPMGGPSNEPSPGPGMGMPTVQEVVALLMQGIDPQALIDQGVPPELIMEAIGIIEQQMAAESAQAAPQGLASQSVMGA